MKMILNAMSAAMVLFVALLGGFSVAVMAQEAVTIQISIKDHRFQPAEVRAPADKPIALRIKNLDPTPAEFESVSLRVEKVIAGNSEGIINLRPLKPGRYKFFDDFHKETTQGALVVQ